MKPASSQANLEENQEIAFISDSHHKQLEYE